MQLLFQNATNFGRFQFVWLGDLIHQEVLSVVTLQVLQVSRTQVQHCCVSKKIDNLFSNFANRIQNSRGIKHRLKRSHL